MALTKTQQRILYSLGQCYQRLNQPLKDKPVKIFISKIDFIQLVKQANFVKKKERALYKNLELLGKKKLIEYKDKKIKLTQKGQRIVNKIEKETKPFVLIRDFWDKEIKSNRQLQTYIKK